MEEFIHNTMKNGVESVKADWMYSGGWTRNATAHLNRADGLEHGILQIRLCPARQSLQSHSLPPPSHLIPLPHRLYPRRVDYL